MTNLKQIRTAAGLTQSKLADISGVNVRIIQHYEQGFKDINNAAAITLYRLSQALNCSIENLLDLKNI